jgi:redox-sensitive bicupin YhaK (pirin superfamily)
MRLAPLPAGLDKGGVIVNTRTVKLVLEPKPVIEGAGVHLNRIFGFSEVPKLDPFLLLDDFRSDKPEDYVKGFPWHPHRGIETITYILNGDVEHGDSLGNKGTISSGDVQWMTAGSGIVHQEMPKGDGRGAMHGFQLWANLPASQKMIPPRYRDIKAAHIPEVALPNGVRIKVIAGTVGDHHGPMDDIVIDPEYLDCSMPAGQTYTHTTHPHYTAMLYAIAGKGRTGETAVTNGTLVLFGQGDQLTVAASEEGLRFLLLTGKPLNEPVAWGGPIVMNTQEELDTALREYRSGTFIKDKE